MTAFATSSTIVLHDFNSETSNDIKIAVPLYPPCGPPNVILIFNFSRSIFFQIDLWSVTEMTAFVTEMTIFLRK